MLLLSEIFEDSSEVQEAVTKLVTAARDAHHLCGNACATKEEQKEAITALFMAVQPFEVEE